MLPGLLSDPGDPLATIDRAADAGCNVGRLFGDYYDGTGAGIGPWDEFRWLVSPCKMLDIWNPGACVGMQTPNVPMRDLDQKNPVYWERLEALFTRMYERKITPWFVMQDFCSTFLTGWQRWLDTFFGNIQRYPGYKTAHYYDEGVEPAIPGERIGEGLDHYYWQYAKWVVDLAYQCGIRKVYLEPWNECGTGNATPDELYAWFTRQRKLYRNLYGVVMPESLTIGSCRPPLDNSKLAAVVDIVDAHGIIEAADIPKNAAGLNPATTILDSDGAPNGKGTSASILGYKNMSIAQAQEIGSAIKGGWIGFGDMPQEQCAVENGPFDSSKIDMVPFREACLASGWTPAAPPVEYVTVTVCTVSGLLPNQYCPATEERQFVKGQQPTTVCAVHVAPAPPAPHKKSWFQKLIEFLFGWL